MQVKPRLLWSAPCPGVGRDYYGQDSKPLWLGLQDPYTSERTIAACPHRVKEPLQLPLPDQTPNAPLAPTHMLLGRPNPVLERCLRVSGRQRAGQLMRLAFLGSMLGVVVVGLVLVPGLSGEVDPRSLAASGGRLLDLVATLQVAAACIFTPLAMAAALQRDADPVAWDVQRTTPLPPWRAVSGLLAGRLIPVLVLVLASLPGLMLLRLVGGVPLQAVLSSTAIAAAVACISAAVAIGFASARLGARPSIIAYLVVVAVVLGATWGLDAALAPPVDASGRQSLTIFTSLNPFLVLEAQLRPGGIAPSDGWWTGAPLRSFMLVSMCVFAMCWLTALLLSNRDGHMRVRPTGATRAPRPIGRHPIAWRESSGRPYAALSDTIRWVLSVMILGCGLALTFTAEHDTTARALLSTMLTTTSGGLLAIGVLLASSAIARERDDRTLDLLLTTPLKPAHYLRGKLFGLVRLVWPPTAAIMLVAATASLVMWVIPADNTAAPTSTTLLPGGLAAFAMSLPGVLCLGITIGLSWSVRSRQWTVAAAISLIVSGIVVIGVAGFAMGTYADLSTLGPVLLGLNPLTSAGPALDPTGWFSSVDAHANVGLLIGGAVGGVAWLIAAWVVLKTTSQSFTPTVRRLAGLD